MKPRSIVIVGDSFSNGDGVMYPNEVIRRMGDGWVGHADKLLQNRAQAQVSGSTPRKSDEQILVDMFQEWQPRQIQGNYATKEYIQDNHGWSHVLQRYTDDVDVINLSIPGGSCDSMLNSLLYWANKNDHYVREHDICVIANYTIPAVSRTSVTTRWVHNDTDYVPRPLSQVYSRMTVHYNPNSGYDFVDNWMVHMDGLHNYEYNFCSNLMLLSGLCEQHGMNFAWSGPCPDVNEWNFMELPLPFNRALCEVEPAFTDILDYTLTVCHDQIVEHNFNPYSICNHFNRPAQNLMGQHFADVINSNADWFWN